MNQAVREGWTKDTGNLYRTSVGFHAYVESKVNRDINMEKEIVKEMAQELEWAKRELTNAVSLGYKIQLHGE